MSPWLSDTYRNVRPEKIPRQVLELSGNSVDYTISFPLFLLPKNTLAWISDPVTWCRWFETDLKHAVEPLEGSPFPSLIESSLGNSSYLVLMPCWLSVMIQIQYVLYLLVTHHCSVPSMDVPRRLCRLVPCLLRTRSLCTRVQRIVCCTLSILSDNISTFSLAAG